MTPWIIGALTTGLAAFRVVLSEIAMATKETDKAVLELQNVLANLAAPAAEQIAYLERLGVLPLIDELALEFDDIVGLVPQLVEEGHLTADQATAISAIDHMLSEMSDRHDLWTTDALLDHPAWQEVRRLAAIGERQLAGAL
jgi:hypothetical protein